MKKEGYEIVQPAIHEYRFVSVGKKAVIKVVQISPLQIENYFNLGFGDLNPDGSVDDTVETNNSDIVKVLATISKIVFDFLSKNPEATLLFLGSTPQRTKVYGLIIKRNLRVLSLKYRLSGLVKEDEQFIEKPLDPELISQYEAFLIRNK